MYDSIISCCIGIFKYLFKYKSTESISMRRFRKCLFRAMSEFRRGHRPIRILQSLEPRILQSNVSTYYYRERGLGMGFLFTTHTLYILKHMINQNGKGCIRSKCELSILCMPQHYSYNSLVIKIQED